LNAGDIMVKQDICTECEQILGTIHLVLSNNATETEVLAAMAQVCSFLPQQYAGLCNEAVSQYGRQLLEALIKYLADPKQLCTMVGLCKEGDADDNSGVSRVEAYEMLKELRVIYASQGVKIFEQKQKVGGMSECATCEFVMDLVQNTLADQPMVDFFKDELSRLCNMLPSTYSAECRNLEMAFEPILYAQFVKKYLDPINFCGGIDVCPNSY